MTQIYGTTTTVIELAKWFSPKELPSSAKSKLFGELVALATPVIEHYRGDLYHDAVWIAKHLDDAAYLETPIYWTVDSHGTHIGTDDTILQHRKTLQYRITVVNHEGVWSAVFMDLNAKE